MLNARRLSGHQKAALVVVLAVAALIVGVRVLDGQSLSNRGSNQDSATPSSATTSSWTGNRWVLAEGAATELYNSGSTGAAFIKAIDLPSTYEIINPTHLEPDPLPSAIHVESFQSFQAIENALTNDAVPTGVRVILYDNEHWPGTPLNEQENPTRYTQSAEQMVHQHGLLFMNTPAADLKAVLDPSAADQYSAYLAKGLATMSKYSDVFEIQAQNTTSAAQYKSFATEALRQARAANPNAILLLGITAKEGGPSALELIQEVKATKPLTQGYWLNIPGTPSQSATGVSAALQVVGLWPSG